MNSAPNPTGDRIESQRTLRARLVRAFRPQVGAATRHFRRWIGKDVQTFRGSPTATGVLESTRRRTASPARSVATGLKCSLGLSATFRPRSVSRESTSDEARREFATNVPKEFPLPADGTPLQRNAEALRVAVQNGKAMEDGRVKVLRKDFPEVICSANFAWRVAAAFHVLLHEAPSRGIAINSGSKAGSTVAFVRGEDIINLTFEESMETVEREPTEEEKRRPSWEWQTSSTRPSGKLAIRLSAEIPFKGARVWSESGSRTRRNTATHSHTHGRGFPVSPRTTGRGSPQKAELEERQRQWKQEWTNKNTAASCERSGRR